MKQIYLITPHNVVPCDAEGELTREQQIRLAVILSSLSIFMLSLLAGYLVETGHEPFLSTVIVLAIGLLLLAALVLQKTPRSWRSPHSPYQPYERGYQPVQRPASFYQSGEQHPEPAESALYEQPQALYPEMPVQSKLMKGND